jgi:hypothetical protein
MTEDEVIAYVSALPGVVVQLAAEEDGSPQIAWGDSFFYYSPDGTVPAATQPFATVVTKDYPGEPSSGLDRPGAFRVNISAGRDRVAQVAEGQTVPDADLAAVDVLQVHPVYGHLGWLAVVDPGPRTDAVTRELLAEAHAKAKARYERRHGNT